MAELLADNTILAKKIVVGATNILRVNIYLQLSIVGATGPKSLYVKTNSNSLYQT